MRPDGTMSSDTFWSPASPSVADEVASMSEAEMEDRLKKNPQMGAQYLTGFTTGRGALPIMVGEDVIGAAGASGAPGGEKDEACVKAGIDKVADQLK